MLIRSIRPIATGVAIASLLWGCTQPMVNEQSSVLRDIPLFTNEDGNASLNVRVIDDRLRTQSFSDVESYDTIRLTLRSTNGLLASDRVKELAATGGSSFDGSFSRLRPGTGYQLIADVYNKTTDPTFTPTAVRGEGIGKDPSNNTTLTLVAGSPLTVTVKINSIGTISLKSSAANNSLSDNVGPAAVEDDTVTVDSGLTTANSPGVQMVKMVFTDLLGAVQGTTATTSAIPATGGATFSWTVPTYVTGTSDTGYLYLYGYDSATSSSPTQLTFKRKQITIYKGASLSPVTVQ